MGRREVPCKDEGNGVWNQTAETEKENYVTKFFILAAKLQVPTKDNCIILFGLLLEHLSAR